MKTIHYSKSDISLDIKFSIKENTIWMSQNEMAILFNKKVPAISKQLTKIRDYIAEYPSVVSKMENTGLDGKTYKMSYFNLDVIQIVGNKINPVFTQEFISWCKEQLDKERNQIMPIQSNVIRFEQGNVVLDVTVEPIEDTVYLSKDQIVTLFDTTRQTVEYHIENIYESGELDKGATCKEILQVQTEGNRQVTRSYILYNLDLVISIGFRVNSKLGITFRNWARKVLKRYTVKGYAVDEHRIELLETSYAYMKQDIQVAKKDIEELKALNKKKKENKSIYYEGEIFDAYDFLCSLVSNANKNIIIIDPYVDEVALSILKNKKPNVVATIITTSKCTISETDLNKYKNQYGEIEIRKKNIFHDRFIVIDKEQLYVLGSSINRIGYRISTIIKLEDKEEFIAYLDMIFSNK